jgi:hypothetical protein
MLLDTESDQKVHQRLKALMSTLDAVASMSFRVHNERQPISAKAQNIREFATSACFRLFMRKVVINRERTTRDHQ